MAVRIRNPHSSALSLPLPFRGALKAGESKVLALTLAQARALLGGSDVFELTEAPDAVGDPFGFGTVVNEPLAARTIDVGDDYVRFTGSAACSATLAKNNIPVMSAGALRQAGTGLLTVVAGAGVTINLPPGKTLVSLGQGSTITWIKVAADQFDLMGDLAT